jgi:hypothetical protein
MFVSLGGSMFSTLPIFLVVNYGRAISNVEDSYLMGLDGQGQDAAVESPSLSLLIRKEGKREKRHSALELNAHGKIMRSLHEEPLRKMRIEAEEPQHMMSVPAVSFEKPETMTDPCTDLGTGDFGDFTTSLTITLDVNTSSSGKFMIMAFRDSMNWYMEAGIMTVWSKTETNDWTSNTAPTGVAPLNDGQWHKLALQYDGTNINIYADGIVRSTLAKDGNILASGNVWYGCRTPPGMSSSDIFDGEARDLRIFDSVVDPVQAAAEVTTAAPTTAAPTTAAPTTAAPTTAAPTTDAPAAVTTAAPTVAASTGANATASTAAPAAAGANATAATAAPAGAGANATASTAAPAAATASTAAPAGATASTAAPAANPPPGSTAAPGANPPPGSTAAPGANATASTAAPADAGANATASTAAPADATAAGNGSNSTATAATGANGTATTFTTTTTTLAAGNQSGPVKTADAGASDGVGTAAATIAPGVTVADEGTNDTNFSSSRRRTSSSNSKDDDTAVIVGVAVGAGVIVLLLICGCVFMMRRRAG